MPKEIGVKISDRDLDQCREEVRSFLQTEDQYMIFTPNAEMLVDAWKDEFFRNVLNKADLNLCDSKGVDIMNFGQINRITGTDFMLEICKIANQEDKSVYFLGSSSKEVIAKLTENISKEFPGLEIVGSHPGPKIELKQEDNINKLGIDKTKNEQILHEILMKSPDVLFVAFGHIKQELWINAYLPDLPGVKVAMGVGGAFDYHSGKKKRAPKLIRKLGFEWLYRLYCEPKRIWRISKALLIFPILSMWSKIMKILKSYK